MTDVKAHKQEQSIITVPAGKRILVHAYYEAMDCFAIPKGVKLMTIESIKEYNNNKDYDQETRRCLMTSLPVGYWYIRWNELIYIDSDGKEVTIESNWDSPNNYNWRRPAYNKITIEDKDNYWCRGEDYKEGGSDTSCTESSSQDSN